jgi:tRNA (cmo5U34)-methyltransferase
MANSHQAVRDAFNTDALIYDRSRRQMVPCFDELYGIAAGLIPFSPERAFEVLDLGAGTGVLSQFIAAKFPRAKILLADIAPEMLKLAQERFAREQGVVDSRLSYTLLA